MDGQPASFQSVDEYIVAFPDDIQAKLQALRTTIRAAAPDAEERISYNMPAFARHGNLVYFAAAKQHIGLYPTASAMMAFRDELAAYSTSQGAIRFPLGDPLPVDLIRRIVEFRVAENRGRVAAKAKKGRAQPHPRCAKQP